MVGPGTNVDHVLPAVQIEWRLRTVAAQQGIWTGSVLRRALMERAAYDVSPNAAVALLVGYPRELKLSTLAALCTTLACGPADLLVPCSSDDPYVGYHQSRALG